MLPIEVANKHRDRYLPLSKVASTFGVNGEFLLTVLTALGVKPDAQGEGPDHIHRRYDTTTFPWKRVRKELERREVEAAVKKAAPAKTAAPANAEPTGLDLMHVQLADIKGRLSTIETTLTQIGGAVNLLLLEPATKPETNRGPDDPNSAVTQYANN